MPLFRCLGFAGATPGHFFRNRHQKKEDETVVETHWHPVLEEAGCSGWDLQAGIILHLFELDSLLTNVRVRIAVDFRLAVGVWTSVNVWIAVCVPINMNVPVDLNVPIYIYVPVGLDGPIDVYVSADVRVFTAVISVVITVSVIVLAVS